MALLLDVLPRVGYADLLSMPDDGRRHEIHGGELVVVPAPRLRHQIVTGTIYTLLDASAATRGGCAVITPFDIVFDKHDVAQPDVVFFRAERIQLLDLDAETRASPDVAAEVLSPSTAAFDRDRKMRMFARYGVPGYWIVDPVVLEIEIHALDPDTAAYRHAQTVRKTGTAPSVLLPDLTVDAARVVIFPP